MFIDVIANWNLYETMTGACTSLVKCKLLCTNLAVLATTGADDDDIVYMKKKISTLGTFGTYWQFFTNHNHTNI